MSNIHQSSTSDLACYQQQLLNKVLFGSQDYVLSEKELVAVIDMLGKDFAGLTKRYAINTKLISKFQARMLIVGKLVVTRSDDNALINNLQQILNISDNELLAGELRAKLIAKVINSGVDYKKFTANKEFKNDIKLAGIIANMNCCGHNNATLQKYSSDEYLFHKLAYADLTNHAIIPMVNKNGKMVLTEARNFISERGVVGCALIPIEYQAGEELDLKILFRGTHNADSAIIDVEKYGAGHSTFFKLLPTIYGELNAICGDLQKRAPNHKITMTIGGHSLGGALAQDLLHSMVSLHANAWYSNYQHDVDYAKIFDGTVLAQLQDEFMQRGKRDDIGSDKFMREVRERFADLMRHLTKQQLKFNVANYQHLLSVKDIELATLNSPGIAHKVRNRTIDTLRLLQLTQHKLNVNVRSLLVNGDIVQKLGQEHIANYAGYDTFPAEWLKIIPIKTGVVAAHTSCFFDKKQNINYTMCNNKDDNLNFNQAFRKFSITESSKLQKIKKKLSALLMKGKNWSNAAREKSHKAAVTFSRLVDSKLLRREKRYAACNIVNS